MSSKNEIERSVEYEYENDILVKEVHYKKTRVDYSLEYMHDETGNVISKNQYYKSGNLKSSWAYEYISIKKEVRQ